MLNAEARGGGNGGAEFAAMAAILDAGYGSVGRETAPRTLLLKPPVQHRCEHCGLPEGFDGRLHCGCEAFEGLLNRVLDALGFGSGIRRFSQGVLEGEGVSLVWENAEVERGVDDREPVAGAFEMDVRFSRTLADSEVESRLRQVEKTLMPRAVEVERSRSGEVPWTCVRFAVDLLDRE